MAKNVTLASLRTQILQRADEQGDDPTSGFVTTSELNQYINNSIGEFSDLLFDAMPTAVRKSVTIAISGGTDTYSLGAAGATDFKHLLGVEFLVTSGSSNWLNVHRTQWAERNKFSLVNVAPMPGVVPFQYDLFSDPTNGWQLQFYPSPVVSGSVRIWYAPAYTTLANDTDTLDGINGLEEFVVVDGAIKVMQKNESDVSTLLAQKQALAQRISDQGKNRDANEPMRVSYDGATGGWDGGNGWGW